MIQASELRIGNYIEDGIVTHLKPNLIVLDSKKAIRPEFANPVLLTPEIIASFGYIDVGGVNVFCYDFKKDGEVMHEYDLEAPFGNGIYTFTCDRRMLCDIKHVHQIQNLHFALTGEELELSL